MGRRGMGSQLAVLAGVTFVAATPSAGSAPTNRDASAVSEKAAVLKVAEATKTAVLQDRPATVCRLLTKRARQNSLLYANYVDRRARQKRPAPKSCRRAVGVLIDEERLDPGTDGKSTPNPLFRRLQSNPSLASLRVIRLRRDRARVRLTVPAGQARYTNDAEIWFVKIEAGWRADFATFAPFDGSSGR